MADQANLFVISAPSGAGKTTLCEKALAAMPDLVRSISMTTREKRGGEKNGQDYFFLDREEFRKKIKNNELLEFARVFENYYGTPKKFVEDNLLRGKDVILNIDVQGAMKIRRKYRGNSVFIFILPPSIKDLEVRLLKRKTDTKLQIKKRLEVARKELAFLEFYDYKIVNDDLKVAFEKLQSIIIASRCKIRKTGGK